MLKEAKKISIIGGPGTGKSTLADNLGKELNISVYHMDSMNYLPNWVQRDKKERDKIILDKIKTDSWIMDGTYRSTLDIRIKNSDLIIFLDYSVIARLKGVFQRYLKNKGIEKNEIPGCKEQMSFTFIKFTIIWYKKKKEINQVLSNNKDKKILKFKNRRQLDNWYKKEFNKKIEI